MIKKPILIVLLFCLPFLLFAETILLYIITESGEDDLEQFGDLIESGVMQNFSYFKESKSLVLICICFGLFGKRTRRCTFV